MKRFVASFLAVGLMAVLCPGFRADEQSDSKKLLTKAVKACGGDAKLKKLDQVNFKAKGTVSENNVEIVFTMEGSAKSFGQAKIDMELDNNGQKMNGVIVINGDQGWAKFMDMVMEVPAEARPSVKQVLYAVRLVHKLNALQDKEFKLSPLGETTVNQKPAVGVKVEHKDYAELNLHLDKETGLPAKLETRIMENNQERTIEFVYGDYKDVGGAKYASKVTVNRDGAKLIDLEVTEVKPQDKLDDSLFAMP